MIGADGGYYSAVLDDTTGRALYPDLDAITAGWVLPAGRLHRVDGGYRLGTLAVRQRLHPTPT